ncbi:MAG: hypothetical protein H7Y27_01635 [Gemmatimonadaceae bacterium]|nr:hypothetical protein [Chitinophagaceae bacterium]
MKYSFFLLLFCLLCCLLLPTVLAAQDYDGDLLWPWRMELGFSVGAMNCLTDLGGKKGNGRRFLKDVNWGYSRPCGGLFFSVRRKGIVALRLQCLRGSVMADDKILKGVAGSGRYLRNLHFRSRVREWLGLLELSPVEWLMPEYWTSVSPYFIGGVGKFSFSPEARLGDRWVALSPLRTEGQGFEEYAARKPYGLNVWVIPVGFGLRHFSGRCSFGMEFFYRFTRTDYLDDVSRSYIDDRLFSKYLNAESAALAMVLADRSREVGAVVNAVGSRRGNPANNDGYFSIELRFGLTVNRGPVE